VIREFAAALPSRLFYAADLAVGLLRGNPCPNCGGRDRRLLGRRRGVPFVECRGCRLYYRPTGFDGALVGAYYDHLYANAGVATETTLSSDQLARAMALEGKDRTALVAHLVPELPRPARICVFGCSWGYELLPFRARGDTVFGVEVGARRRAFGRASLGLPIHASVEELARAEGGVDLVLSSHVLEHIPRMTAALDRLRSALCPSWQVHVTPSVERFAGDAATRTNVGREHPIGVTAAFWQRFAGERGLRLAWESVGDAPGQAGEAIACLRENQRDA
jgi:hypothetical protein